MYQNVVIPDMNPGSRLLNRSSYPYTKLDSRFTVRSAGCPGMTRNGFASSRHPETLRAAPWQSAVSGPAKKGFTLIELLVVVLIIGILASMALPQYQLAVRKAEWSNIVVRIKPLLDAEALYKLANGVYTYKMADMGIECPPNFSYEEISLGSSCVRNASRGARGFGIYSRMVRYWDKNMFIEWPFESSFFDCRVVTADKAGHQLCKSMGGVVMTEGSGNITYRVPKP